MCIVPKVRAARLIPPRPQSSSSSSSQRSRLEQMRSAGENKASFTRKARSVENNKKPTPEERTYIEDEGYNFCLKNLPNCIPICMWCT